MMLKVESFQELETINRIANEMQLVAPIAIRLNPDVDAKTHPYISTGLAENKFGIDINEGQKAFQFATSLSNLKVVGVDMHIGSQITSPLPYVDAIKKVFSFINQLNIVILAVVLELIMMKKKILIFPFLQKNYFLCFNNFPEK